MPFSITMHVTLPKNKFADKKWKSELGKALRRTGRDLKGLFEKTTFGWSGEPKFQPRYSDFNNAFFVTVGPEGQFADKWELVNAGSPRHDIPARKGGLLSFRPGYRSATRPGTLMSRRAYRSGKQVAAKIVHHPGFEARRFTETIRDEYERKFVENTQDAINTAARSK